MGAKRAATQAQLNALTESVIWWRVKHYGVDIESIKVYGETDKFIVTKDYMGRASRNAKVSTWDAYYKTWAEARQVLVDRITDKLTMLRGSIAAEEADLNKVLALVGPI